MPISDTVVCTATSYSNLTDPRCQQSLETVYVASRSHQVVVIEASKDRRIAKAFMKAGAIVVEQYEEGMAQSRAEAVEFSWTLPGWESYVFWTEPEKIGIICHIDELIDYARRCGSYLVIPSRTVEAFATYPPYQAESEMKGNWRLNQLTRQLYPFAEYFDYFFGPRLYRRHGNTAEILRDTVSLGPYAPLMVGALRMIAHHSSVSSLCVSSCPVSYRHPPEQTATETGNAEFEALRDRQRVSIITMFEKEVERIGALRADRR
ncbi:MAG: hypothetical protein CEO22_529 [Candidatus Berkelbacteria bacterium Gr01-1014_85]|uniref:Uncharacterized protein n=1 Tax=Candidatus Berkelbacteria bacterium Gr01-1014_85 TaxID=2017150 RepID=A0A554JA74_9BACT|nr:MAG: hypothetical protein CEO22_529 [Candidatus Berkelbacteria bacterium Gr01-1014_85]